MYTLRLELPDAEAFRDRTPGEPVVFTVRGSIQSLGLDYVTIEVAEVEVEHMPKDMTDAGKRAKAELTWLAPSPG